jgi:hypothetical protein
LITDSALRKAYGQQLRERAMMHFDLVKIAHGYTRAYRALVSDQPVDLTHCFALP